MKRILFLIFFFCFRAAFAQHPVFYQMNDESGLPTNEVYKVVQDDFGYIWLGCDAGLYRYDGFSYKKYSTTQQNGRGISFLQLDSKQRVWCKNFYGQICRVEGDSLKVVKTFSTSNASYPQFTIDSACNVWIGDSKRITVYSENGDSIKSIPLSENVTETIALKFFRNELYLIFSDLSAVKYDLKKNRFNKLESNLGKKIYSKNCMVVEHKGQQFLFVETGDMNDKYGIYKVVENRIEPFMSFNEIKKEERLYSLFSDGEFLWLTSSFGAFTIDHPEKIFFDGEKISCMLYDKEGQFWFSSLQSGVFVIPQPEVQKYNSGNSGLTDNNVVSVTTVDQNHLLIGSYHGKVFSLDVNSGAIEEKYQAPQERFISVKYIESLERYTIISRGRFCIVDNANGKQYFPNISNIRKSVVVGDTVYVLASEFVAKICLSEMIRTNKADCIYINKLGGRAMEYDEKRQLFYFLLSDGLYVLNEHNAFSELKNGEEKILGSSLHFKNGMLWVAGISAGVYGIENKKVKFHFTQLNELKENSVRTIEVDDRYLWVCTENYLHRIDLASKEVGLLNVSNSINPKDINAIKVQGQRVFLATNKGLLSFPIDLNWKNKVAPRIAISTVQLNNNELRVGSRLSLPYDNNNLSLSISSVSLKSKGAYVIQYRLQGLDSSWNSLKASASAIVFSRIPSGDFVLQIKALNEHGVGSSILALPIVVETPFWQRWWFFMLLIAMASGIVALVFIARIKYIKRRADLKNKITASQLTALKSQMNPHFMFNTLNSLQDLILKKDIKSTNYYLSKYGMLMRKVLEISGKDEITLAEELEILDTYLQLEKLRFGDDFNFEIRIADEIEKEEVFLSPMIIQPFVENAIKHGLMHKKEKKELVIQFHIDKKLICTIDDNGVGRKRAQEIKMKGFVTHQSFATNATEKRIELLNSFGNKKYSIEIVDKEKDGLPLGTKVVISIPA